MGAGYYSYDEMAAFVADLQRRIAQLEAENSGLRQQLDSLRRGVGVSVNIMGQTLPVAAASYLPSPAASYPAAPPASPPIPTGMQQREAAAWNSYHHAARGTPPPAPPAPQPQPQPMPQPQAQHPFPEDAWLSGSGPAVRRPRDERPASPRRQREPEPVRGRYGVGAAAAQPSERMTPEWLREGAAPSGDYASTSAPRPAHHSPDEHAWDDTYAPATAGRRRGYQGNNSAWLS